MAIIEFSQGINLSIACQRDSNGSGDFQVTVLHPALLRPNVFDRHNHINGNMIGERLLERLRFWEGEPHRRGSEDQRRCIDSIIDHLLKMLNTRQGNVQIANDYGVPDFLDFLQSYPDSLREIESSLKAAIERYEPRLSCTSVTFIPEEDESLTLRFQISARLANDGERQVYFETMVDTDGRINVHR